MKNLKRTDLATEFDISDSSGIIERTQKIGSVKITSIEVKTEEAAKRLKKPTGKYITVDIGKIWFSADEQINEAASIISDQLVALSKELCGKIPESLLIIGLGNRNITADSLGHKVVEGITVTRHIREHSSELYKMLGGREISALAPGVLGQTGIETAELVLSVCRSIHPELVIAIDSLCAFSTDRLATSIQLGTSGIIPGSGIGNSRLAINRETLGIPVIAVGAPTVVDSATLVIDALERAGIGEIDNRLADVLRSGRSFFVTPKETDMIMDELSKLTAQALDKAFG